MTRWMPRGISITLIPDAAALAGRSRLITYARRSLFTPPCTRSVQAVRSRFSSSSPTSTGRAGVNRLRADANPGRLTLVQIPE